MQENNVTMEIPLLMMDALIVNVTSITNAKGLLHNVTNVEMVFMTLLKDVIMDYLALLMAVLTYVRPNLVGLVLIILIASLYALNQL